MVDKDKQLIMDLKDIEKREAAFRLLVQAYQQRLYWHIRKIVIDHEDADDLLQNVFVKVWKNIGNFREDSSLFTWLFRIATNESLSFLQQKKRRNTFSIDNGSDYLVETFESDPHFAGDELQRKLQVAVLQLPEKQRIVFNMKYFDEMKYEEMAEILQTSVGALKASYHHAVKKIEAYFDNE
ncbi:MAG: RNA polymerase sigma factor [Marinilabiliales bacterium]|nr:RNA polymerase sigma factor [Marinilabiliales bacterium]